MRPASRLALLRPTPSFVTRARAFNNVSTRALFASSARFYSSAETEKNNTKEEGKNEEAETANASEKTPEELKMEEFNKEIEICKKDARKFKDHYARAVADFRNLQEITKKDVQKARDFALQKFAKDLLESVDNFGHALNAFKPETIEKSKELKDLYDGVQLTKDVFEKTLAKHGIEKIDPVDQEFDPNLHEATFEFPDPNKKPNTVFHVQQVGYSLNGRVIRPAKVGIVKDPEN
ncbi:Mitochondrial matrix cochaperone [Hanseniaspora osmophila]|uniref:GrpE protein homolog n=1 Tax=Hanseniaspora osmophila TaxID=56408 RepID=A0A1E5R7W7_9ASCO|nr:GrpE, mitochondrial [Hanseniaspora osmophila]